MAVVWLTLALGLGDFWLGIGSYQWGMEMVNEAVQHASPETRSTLMAAGTETARLSILMGVPVGVVIIGVGFLGGIRRRRAS